MSRMPKGMPSTRAGWARYYADRFNKTGSEQAAHLALWHMVLSLEFDGVDPFEGASDGA